MRNHINLMASYNEWMNSRLYSAAATLSADELTQNKGAFFGSLLGTLNHLVVADRIWLRRFAAHPAGHIALNPVRELPEPQSPDEILYHDFGQLTAHRVMLDALIKAWAASLTEEDLDCSLRYSNMKGVVAIRRFSSLIMHFFNHQAHHRGQATTLLSQTGRDMGVTDLLMLIPNEVEAKH
jgi:uncharacterized damage-inducible protein DinB